MKLKERIQRLGKALQLKESKRGFDVVWSTTGGIRRWWLIGGVEGDQPLPQTGDAKTLKEALESAEAWLAPEIDLLDE